VWVVGKLCCIVGADIAIGSLSYQRTAGEVQSIPVGQTSGPKNEGHLAPFEL
jgi:hypothetical protein